MNKPQAVDFETHGTNLQNNADVRRIYTSLQADDDGGWDVVTIIEAELELDPEEPGYRADACDRLIRDIEADMRAGMLSGSVKIKRF